MRLLYVHRTAGARVEGVHIRELVNAFRKLGHEVRLISPPFCDPMRRRSPTPRTGSRKPHPLRSLIGELPRLIHPFVFELLEILYSLLSFPVVLARSILFRPHAIYERASPFQFAATLTGQWLGIPVIQEANQTVAVGRLRRVFMLRQAAALERWVFRQAAAVVTVSSRFKELIAATGIAPDRIAVIPNAADPERFRTDVPPPDSLQLPADDKVVLGYVGAFVKWHSLDRLLELVSDTPGRPALPVRLLLIGDGPERPSLARRAAAAGAAERVVFTGAVPHDRLPAHLRPMDAAIMADATDYASPVKLFEYMAMGKAIVAPRVPPIEEVIRHGETGLLFEPHDERSFRSAVARVVADAAFRERLGRNARELLLREHTWVRNAERILALLELSNSRTKERPSE